MDVLVLLEQCDDDDAAGRVEPTGRPNGARPLAYVQSAPEGTTGDRLFGGRSRTVGREVVTLCGPADAERLAVALAAVVEGRRGPGGQAQGTVVRHLGVWDGLGATGDAAWRDWASGQVLSQDVAIDAVTIAATARQLMLDCGRVIRQTAADLCAPDWPEGTRRAISISIPTPGDSGHARLGAVLGSDDLLASLREADGYDGYYAHDAD